MKKVENIFVCAGDLMEFRRFCMMNAKSTDNEFNGQTAFRDGHSTVYRYVNSLPSLLGFSNFRLLFTGSFERHRDHKKMASYYHSKTGNHATIEEMP